MSKFFATLNDGNYINIQADSMAYENNYILVYNAGTLVAYLDVAAVVVAYISKGGI